MLRVIAAAAEASAVDGGGGCASAATSATPGTPESPSSSEGARELLSEEEEDTDSESSPDVLLDTPVLSASASPERDIPSSDAMPEILSWISEMNVGRETRASRR